MNPKYTVVVLASAVALSLLSFACASSDSDELAPASFGQPCASSGCVAGLYCAKDGFSAGLCTMDCKGNSECSARFGSGTVCGDQCYRECGEKGKTCSEGTTCYAGICSVPTSRKWACQASGGVCKCASDGSITGDAKCPSNFVTQSQYGCCELGGAAKNPATWNSCVCQLNSAIPSGQTCYTLPISLGQNYGTEVGSCPGTN